MKPQCVLEREGKRVLLLLWINMVGGWSLVESDGRKGGGVMRCEVQLAEMAGRRRRINILEL